MVKAETLSGQVLRAHATKHQSHLLTTRKTSTPVELESGHGTSYGVMVGFLKVNLTKEINGLKNHYTKIK